MTKTLACVGVVLAVLVARIDVRAEGGEDERAAFEGDLERMKREEPDSYAKFNKGFAVYAQMTLARLGYGVGPFDGVLDEKTQAALREYEHARRIPVTGDPMSFDTFTQLQTDNKALDYVPVSLPPKVFVWELWDEGYFTATGTWVIQGERHPAVPEQTSKIECDRKRGTCVESTARIIREERGLVKMYLTAEIETYPIERWDQYEIVIKPRQLTCVRYVLRFNRVEKSARGVRTRTRTEGVCSGVEAEKQVKLVEGFQVYWDLYRHANKIQRRLTIKADRPALAMRHGWRPVPPWMFVTANGTPFASRAVRKNWNYMLRLAGLADSGFTPHSMRHSFACWHIAHGRNAKWVQQQLGHASIAITLDVYASSFALHDTDAADDLATGLLGNKLGNSRGS